MESIVLQPSKTRGGKVFKLADGLFSSPKSKQIKKPRQQKTLEHSSGFQDGFELFQNQLTNENNDSDELEQLQSSIADTCQESSYLDSDNHFFEEGK
jgi:uncharacterized membrane protein YgaE (UPF0421/DUF939 family)